jgi:2-keto-4-pentenoate hydratase
MNLSKLWVLITINFIPLVGILSPSITAQELKINQPSSNLILTQNNLDTIAKKLAKNYLEKIPINEINKELSLENARKIQREFVSIISEDLGKIVGYKAGLTNKKVQERFKVNHPLTGVLLEKMLLPSGAVISSKFGAVPMVEGDLMLRVKSEEINKAKTPEETLKYIDAVIPFLELPDLGYSENIKPTAANLLAINVGARLGIMGEPIVINNSQEWLKKLNNIQVIIRDENNQELGKGESSNLLENPLNVVLWLKEDLNKQGIMLKQGDLLSLGSITPLIPVKKEMTITVEYLGLETNPLEIKVKFSD